MKTTPVDNITSIIQVLARHYPHGIALAQVAEESEVQRDTARRLLLDMREHDWVRGIEHADGTRWTVGLGLSRLGLVLASTFVERMRSVRDDIDSLFPDGRAQWLQAAVVAVEDDGERA